MKPSLVRWRRVGELDEAVEALAELGDDAKLIAGGQSLVPLLALRMSSPAVLVDIDRCAGLDYSTVHDGDLYLGALVRHRRLLGDPLVAAHAPLLASVAGAIGHGAIRNRGTLGGSLSHADPAAELPAAMVGLEATMVCVSAALGARRVPAERFVTGPYSTVLADDEILAAVHVPAVPPGTRTGFAEIAPRSGDFARAGAVCTVRVGPDGTVSAVRLVLFAVGPAPLDVSAAATGCLGAVLADGDWQHQVALQARQMLDRTGHQAQLAEVVCRRALHQAAVGGTHGP